MKFSSLLSEIGMFCAVHASRDRITPASACCCGAWEQEWIEICHSVETLSRLCLCVQRVHHCSLGWECHSGPCTMHCSFVYKNNISFVS